MDKEKFKVVMDGKKIKINLLLQMSWETLGVMCLCRDYKQ